MSKQNDELPKPDWWFMEQYHGCGCTFVAKKKGELLGYCGKHGSDRMSVIRIPPAQESDLGDEYGRR